MSGIEPIEIDQYRKIVFLTGAGISAASGLRTYRGPDGLWSDAEIEKLSFASTFAREPEKVCRFLLDMRRTALRAEPNEAHRAITRLQERAGCYVITQNVDSLHTRAGTKDVIELHGSLARTRCGSCDRAPFEDRSTEIAQCDRCGKHLRPDVVLFEEMIPVDAERASKRAIMDCDLFIAVGTSGTVSPASNFVRSAAYEKARTILVNLEPMTPRNPAFHEEVLGRAEEILPRLLGV
jgi:NAD-dependent deacetylase